MQVVSAAASGVASFAATSDGTVWVWGSSKRGQLGLGPGVIEAHQPKRIPGLEGVMQLAAGWGHVLALKGEGLGCIAGLPASAAHPACASSLACCQTQPFLIAFLLSCCRGRLPCELGVPPPRQAGPFFCCIHQ